MQKLALLFLIGSLAFAQQHNKSEIVGSGNYYYGSGTAFDVNEACDHALAELTKQISVKVESSFRDKIIEKDRNVSECTKASRDGLTTRIRPRTA